MFGTEQTTLSTARIDKVRAAKQTVDDHVSALAEEMRQGKSERLKRYLAYAAQFHHYSFGNLILAMFQRPDATRLAGLRQWNKLGRKVKPGEKGVMILAPVTVRKKEDQEEKAIDGREDRRRGLRPKSEEITIFKPVYVFDIAQTEGAEPPAIISATGDPSRVWPAPRRLIEHASIEIQYVASIPISPSALGVSLGGRILLRSDLESADAFRTLAHEYAHELLHHQRTEPDRRIRETEADAVAYVVCRRFGLTCDSSDYLLLYNSKPELLFARLDNIRRAADSIIYGVETELEAVERIKQGIK